MTTLYVPHENINLDRSAIDQWIKAHSALFECFFDGFCVVDRKNRLVAFNESFVELSGRSYRNLCKKDCFCDALHFNDCPTRCPAEIIMSSGQALRIASTSAQANDKLVKEVMIGGVPILSPANGEVLGAFLLFRDITGEVSLLKNYDIVQRQAVIDGMTSVQNKSSIERSVLLTSKLFLREKFTLSLMIFDLDFFKKINDTYGHAAGDLVLKKFARRLVSHFRETDFVGRFGGEEFLVVLPRCDAEGMKKLADRLLIAMTSDVVEWQGSRIQVTTSIGGTSTSPAWATMTSAEIAEKLINQADQALYHAKHSGRNQYCNFSDVPKKVVP